MKVDGRTHVLYLIDHLWNLGGAERALLRTARLLPSDRYRCTIGTFRLCRTLPAFENQPWPIVEFLLNGALDIRSLRTAFRLRQFIRSEGVDIVHTFAESANLWGGVIAKLSGCRVLVSSRRDMGILRTTKHRIAYRLLNPFVDQVQAVSNAVREWAIREERLDPAKVVTVPNGIEIDSADAPTPRSSDVWRSHGFKDVSRCVLTVANVRAVKGIDVIIRAAHQVAQKRPGVRFFIAGRVNDQEYYAEMQELVRDLGLGSTVHFLGECTDVWALLRSCDVFCLPSRSEGMPNALLEAMACGLPCVTTAVGGNLDLITNDQNGLLVPPDNPDATAERILFLLNNWSYATEMGQIARRTVQKTFSAQTVTDHLTRLYDELLQGTSTLKPHTTASCSAFYKDIF